MTTLIRRTGVNATGTGPKLNLLKNVIFNPRAINSTGINSNAGTGGTAALTRPTTGGPLTEVPSFARITWSVAPSAIGQAGISNGLISTNLITPGLTYVFKAYVRASWAATVVPKFGWHNGASYVGGSNGTGVLLTPNTWTAITHEATLPGSGVDRIQMNTDLGTGTTLPSIGSTLDSIGWFVFAKPAGVSDATPYGDGAMTGWTWLGTAHASASEGYGVISG